VKLWNYYLQLVQVEEAFRTLKSDLAIRPIFHQEPPRIEAHVFVAFLAYWLVRNARTATQSPRTRTHRPQRAGEICRRADGRCTHPDHGRPRASTHPLYPTRARTGTPAGALAAHASRPTAAKNQRCPDRLRNPPVVQTLGGALQAHQSLTVGEASNPRSSARTAARCLTGSHGLRGWGARRSRWAAQHHRREGRVARGHPRSCGHIRTCRPENPVTTPPCTVGIVMFIGARARQEG
jgi:hypothetical protein